jgi:hypothetical protein
LDRGAWLGYVSSVAKTVILSDETVRSLIEAHASLAAWYYQMSDALREAGAGVHAPSDDQRRAYVAQLGQTYPEIAAIAAEVTEPRAYVPPPAVPVPTTVTENAGVAVSEPPKNFQAPPAMIPGAEPGAAEPAAHPAAEQAESPAEPSASQVPPPPMIVDPSKVKYE